MQELKAKLVGVSPIMFHNERLANPLDPGTRELKRLTGQKKKTDELREQIRDLEWRLGFYEVDGIPVVPADNVLACCVEGSRKLKKGKDASAGVVTRDAFFPLEFDGPKTIDKMLKDGRFVDYRSVVVQRQRMMRARPIVRSWSLSVTLLFDPEIISLGELQQSLDIAGERVGLGERRPRHGRFVCEFS